METYARNGTRRWVLSLQIAKRVNETRSIYQADMDEIKGEMEKLWKVQKAMLRKQPVMSQ